MCIVVITPPVKCHMPLAGKQVIACSKKNRMTSFNTCVHIVYHNDFNPFSQGIFDYLQVYPGCTQCCSNKMNILVVKKTFSQTVFKNLDRSHISWNQQSITPCHFIVRRMVPRVSFIRISSYFSRGFLDERCIHLMFCLHTLG